ncbi:MAG: adenosine deaminase, partial [Candidatus Marinimicrobia bacterium]|nr:adenosine deaminase [Candidatus Neomarinimicrobiota bacterium]
MVSNKKINSFIRDLPKVELHLHLEGAIHLYALLQLIEKYEGNDYISFSDLEIKFEYSNFMHFLNIWVWKNQFIREYDDFEFIAEQVSLDLAKQNVRYVEMEFSPSDFRRSNLQPQKIAIAIRNGLNKHSDKIKINLIADLVRDEEDKLPQLKQILEVKDQGIIGIGLGGKEKEFPPYLFTNAFLEAKREGLRTTCHAGEAAGPDYIWQAIKDLNVDRIGHGTNAYKDSELVQYLV